MRLQQAQLASVMTWEPVADEDQSTKARVRVREVPARMIRFAFPVFD